MSAIRTVPSPAHSNEWRPDCRPGCAACCIAPSISTAIPGMPEGKPAGVPCVQLDAQMRCRLFGQPQRPAVCGSLQPSTEMCGSSRSHAMLWLERLDALTAPPTPLNGRVASQ
jgi:Fe-S-cluster containining protein